MSFSVNSYTKPVVANKSELTQSQEQIELNNLLMSSVLWFSKDMSMDNEKNKYVLMDDLWVQSKPTNIFNSRAEKQTFEKL